jgi:hypothetical protein
MQGEIFFYWPFREPDFNGLVFDFTLKWCAALQYPPACRL